VHRPLTGNREFSLATTPMKLRLRECGARSPGVYLPVLVAAGRGTQVSRRSDAALLPGRLRAAELIGALSLATDFGVGEPLEHGLRTTVIAVRLAESLGLEEDDRRAVYYVALLRYAGCTAESHLDAALFGDEIAVRAAMAPALFGSRAELFLAIARTMHAGEPARWRAVTVARALVQLRKTFRKGAAGHCEVTQAHALHLGLGTEIQAALGDVFERWDGNGWPAGRQGEQVPLPVRLMQVAEDADLQHGLGGLELAVSVVRKRAGAAFDPAVADAFCRVAPELLDGLDGAALWENAMAAEPGEHAMLEGEQVDEGLRVLGDFADLTIPYTLGHSAAVAELAATAGEQAGLDREACVALRRAGLVHNVGRVALTASVWNKPGPLSRDEQEKVRLYPYYTERVLQHPELLRSLGEIASRQQERLDGSGYPRGAAASDLSPTARILAAANAYHAMIEPRPHRPAYEPTRAAELLRDEVRAGKLDATAVAAVLEAAGQQAGRLSPPRPAGLTDREAEVLSLLARGLMTKQIGQQLAISPKTVDQHIQNVYAKIGVSTRAAATLFATQHGLTGVELAQPR
jgi:HD-GYP domain-containing protein (c-di-GMP phosphodiesterase class II)